MGLNLADSVDVNAELMPDKTALIFDRVRTSFGELAAASKRVANILNSKGIGRGDTVAIMLPNTPHFPIIYFGILYAGATVLPMNPTLKRRGILHQLQDSGAKAIFAWRDVAAEAAKAVADVPHCRLVSVEPGLDPEIPPAGESFLALMAGASPEYDMVQTDPSDTAVLIYTSSIGDELYGAELTHFNLFSSAMVIREHAVCFAPDDNCLAVLPLFHGFGQTTMMTIPLLCGSAVALMPRFDPQQFFNIIQKERITITCLVPTMMHLLLNFKKDEHFDISSVRLITVGGSAMPTDLALAFMERFKVPVVEGYGLTETSPVISTNTVQGNRLGSVGRPLWGCRIRIMREDGSFAKPNETGEIVMRGHNLMKGCRNRPDIYAQIMAGGWFHTGDYGYLDEDGYIYITGLKKDIIIRAGMNVYPFETEKILMEHPAVQEAAMVGIPDPVRGHEPKAFIVLKPGMEVSVKELAAYCREQMASYKCPRTYEFLDSLPRDASGKVRKDLLLKRTESCNGENGTGFDLSGAAS